MQGQDLKNAEGKLIKEELNSSNKSESEVLQPPFVSFLAEVPEPIQAAMATFIESHPNWDQYRLIQAALAGFLVQNGLDSRSVTRLYLDNMFSRKSAS